MKKLSVLMVAALTIAIAPAPAAAAGLGSPRGADPATEDVLYMADGRVLHGQILEEKGDAIVFELVARDSGIRTKLTFLLEEIAKVEKDVAVEGAPEQAPGQEDDEKSPAKSKSAPRAAPRSGDKAKDNDKEEEPEVTYGARRTSENPDAPSFYVVPMKGQMGTDVATAAYKDMIEDIRAHKPDVLVIEMFSRDDDDMLMSMIGQEEQGIPDFDEFRQLVNIFKDDLGDIRQVVWVRDSVGPSSVVALAWDEIYLSPEARLGGLKSLGDDIGFEKWADEDVRGKMTAAFMSFVKGFLAYGGHSEEIADAMVRPKFMLSGTWKGREVGWRLDTTGDYVVDKNDEKTAEFRAKTAEDLCISDGTAENLDDLALLLGFREYRIAEGRGESAFEDYTEGWRRAFENCKTWIQDYQQFMGWAGGEDELKYLGQAKGRLEKVLASIERYSAVELRLAKDLGVRKFDVITNLEQLKERIRMITQARRAGGRGSGGGVGSGGG